MIVGYDPGTTAALAVLDLKGEVLMLVTMRGGVRQARELIAPFKPVIIASDKRFMASVQHLASSFGAHAFFPKKDLTLSEKSALVSAHSPQNQHEKDALASALYAYKHNRSTIRKVIDKERDIFKMLLEKKLPNLSEINRKRKKKEPKTKKKNVELERRVKDLERKLKISQNIIDSYEKKLKKIKENPPKTTVKRRVLSKGLKSERSARIRLEKKLTESHSRISKIEAELKKLKKLESKNTSQREKEDIRGWILNMVKDYKSRFTGNSKKKEDKK